MHGSVGVRGQAPCLSASVVNESAKKSSGGSFATALLSGRAMGITRVHGQEQEVALGGRVVKLYPLYHPAAALYTPSMLAVLERDIARLPALLAPATPSEQGLVAPTVSLAEPAVLRPVQLGLF